MQTVKINGDLFTIFFDSGCMDFCCTHDAVQRLSRNAGKVHLEVPGPLPIGGVGGMTIEAPYGIYTVRLPLHNGKEVAFNGMCLDEITSEFPKYPIKGKVENDIKSAYIRSGGDPNDLPKLSSHTGGKIDFMIGMQYNLYQPKEIFKMGNGLAIYRSLFENAEGGRGVIGGPHHTFTMFETNYHIKPTQSSFLAHQILLKLRQIQDNQSSVLINHDKQYNTQFLTDVNHESTNQLNDFNDAEKNTQESTNQINDLNDEHTHFIADKTAFETAEDTGTQISYRCVNCRGCKTCKENAQYENVSIREEVEQDLIVRSVTVDTINHKCIARLPFMFDPRVKLAPNIKQALKVYNQMVRMLQNVPADKEAVLKAFNKLLTRGYVSATKELSEEQQQMLKTSDIQNFIPWRVAWKASSITTPCRPVFDASMATPSGYSLNSILAKGINGINKLQEIIIRWFMHAVAFHCDITSMYNNVELDERDWCYQRFFYDKTLDPNSQPEEYIIKTNIYGVKSSGNIAEYAVRETARQFKDVYPAAYDAVVNDSYVDDTASGDATDDLAVEKADTMQIGLKTGGFALKGIAMSGRDPPDTLSDDGVTVAVGGLKWYVKEDLISLNLGAMTFSKKKRGRKKADDGKVPEKLTRKHCTSKVYEVFDLVGRLTPLTAPLKLDLHELVTRKLQWDDVLPDELRSI